MSIDRRPLHVRLKERAQERNAPIDEKQLIESGRLHAPSMEELAAHMDEAATIPQRLAEMEQTLAAQEATVAELHEAKAEVRALNDRLQALETATAPLLERSSGKPGKQEL